MTCVENGAQTHVTVDYDLSALSDAGAERLEHFAANYDDMLAHWQHHASRASPDHPEGRARPEDLRRLVYLAHRRMAVTSGGCFHQ